MATVKVTHPRDAKQAVLERSSSVVVAQAGPLHVREKRLGHYYLVEQGKEPESSRERLYGSRRTGSLEMRRGSQRQSSRRRKRKVSVAAVPGLENTYVSTFQDKIVAVGKEKGKPVELIR